MKGTIPVLLGLLLLAAPAAAQAQYTYTPNAGGITITGYSGSLSGTVAIPCSINGLLVTSIGNGAAPVFSSSSLTSVMIPESVTNIGDYAFEDLRTLSGVFFEGNAPTADTTVFQQDTYATVYYLQGATGWGATFAGLRPVQTYYTYPGSAPGTIGYQGYLCGAATIPPTNSNGLPVTSIGSNAFNNSPFLTSVTIPDSVTSIEGGAFYDCSGLTNVTIDDGVTNIGDHAFYGCLGLTSVTIPDGVTNIGVSAFGYCPGLAGVSIPASVNSLGDQVFADCANLTTITVDPLNSFYSSTNGVLFDESQATLLQYPGGLGGSYTIPDSVTDIGDYAFYDCSGLTSVTIPGGVTNIGDYAFYGCLGLANVTIANGVSNIGVAAFCFCTNLASVTIPGSVANIGENAFDGCLSLTNATIANGVTNIGASAFCSCSSLTSVTVPGSVTNIGDDAFEYCASLINATIANGVNSIGKYSFWDCASPASVYFTGNAPSPLGAGVFYSSNNVTAYYLPGTAGWSNTLAGVPAVLWNPLIQAGGASFGVQNNQFGFDITNTANLTVVVEACTNLAGPVWTPLQTVTLTNGLFHFSEPLQTYSSGRYYGLGFP